MVKGSFVRRAPMFPLVKMLFLTGEGFTLWSSRPLSVYSIFFIFGGDIRARRGSFLLSSTKLLLQIINLSLHGFIIVSLVGYVTFPSKTASIRVDDMPTVFLIVLTISFTFKTVDLILLMNISWFCMVRTSFAWSWFRHDSTEALVFPTDSANCRVTICSPKPKVLGY